SPATLARLNLALSALKQPCLAWASWQSVAPLLVLVLTPPPTSAPRSPKSSRSSPASRNYLRLRTTSRLRQTATHWSSSPAQCASSLFPCTRSPSIFVCCALAHCLVSLKFTFQICSQVLPSCLARSTLFCVSPQLRFPHRLSATMLRFPSVVPRASSSSTSSSR